MTKIVNVFISTKFGLKMEVVDKKGNRYLLDTDEAVRIIVNTLNLGYKTGVKGRQTIKRVFSNAKTRN